MSELTKKKKEQDPNKLNRIVTNKLASEVTEFVDKMNINLEQQIIILRRAVKMKLTKRVK